MSVQELKALARKHWEEWLPDKVRKLRAEGQLNEALKGAALRAQTEIEHLMKIGYQASEAREVALAMFILLPPEPEQDGLDDEMREELAEMEREYQRNPPFPLEQDGLDEEMLQENPTAPMSTPTKPFPPTSPSASPPSSPKPAEGLKPIREWEEPVLDYAIQTNREFAQGQGAGGQGVMPGAERISDAELAKRRAEHPLKPKAKQKPADEGLFSDDSKQADLVDQIAAKARKPDA